MSERVLAQAGIALVVLFFAVLTAVVQPFADTTSLGPDAPVVDEEPSPSTVPLGPTVPTTEIGSPAGSVFGPRSIFRQELEGAPLHPQSEAMVADLTRQLQRSNGGAALNVRDYTSSFYRAVPSTPRTEVVFDDCQDKGRRPTILFDEEFGAPFVSVPIPAGAQPSTGTDQELSVWAPHTDQLWELWKAHEEPDGWHACWGGRIDHVSTSPGYFPPPTGATATGLAGVGCMIGIAEAQAGSIDHAVCLAIPEPAAYFVPPARRGDGRSTREAAVPEGSRLRLDPALDVRALGLSPIATMIAEAAQTYGFILKDGAKAVAVQGESAAPYVQRDGTDPWAQILRGQRPFRAMAGFPWHRLQVVQPLPTD